MSARLAAVSLPSLDFGLTEGWYGYQVNAIDIFGRFSAPSAFAEWRQWTPAPDPKPWYYVDPPADRVIRPSSVRVLDRTAPPPLAFIEAWVLDPTDPVVVRDPALAAWRQTLPAAQRDTLVGLACAGDGTSRSSARRLIRGSFGSTGIPAARRRRIGSVWRPGRSAVT